MHLTLRRNFSTNGGLRKNSFLAEIIKNKYLYLLVLPGVIFFVLFYYVPMYGIIIAFKDYSLVKGIFGSPFIGIDHFKELFSSKEFFSVLRNSLLISFYRLLAGFPAPIIIALIFNEVRKMAFKRVVQTVIYIPHFISWVIVTGIVMSILSTNDGIVNIVLKSMGQQPINFLTEPAYFKGIVVFSYIWKEAGWGTIIYLAALSVIDVQLYEAAIVDGANRFKQLIHVTLPGIKGTIIIMLILQLGYILDNSFEQIFLLINPLTYSVGDVLETFVYRAGLMELKFDYATAVGLFKSVVGLILILSSNFIARKFGEEGIY